MSGLSVLWLPILLSAVAVFIVSSIIHMATPWHKGDYPKLPNEDAFMNAVRPLGIPPGDYFVPRASSSADMKAPEFMEKMKKGPVVVMTVMPSGFTMGRSLLLWFLYSAVVAGLAGYIAWKALGTGAPYRGVFKVVGSVAFLAYTAALWQMWIWYRRALGTTIRATIDGAIYAAVTAGMFGWLWPR